MSKIEFISHESFPEDEYTKELVYLCLEGKYRIAYVRKASKSGGLFWSVAMIGAQKHGKKEFYPAFLQDSNFLERDIKNFLDARKWEHGPSASIMAKPIEKPKSIDEVAYNDALPF